MREIQKNSILPENPSLRKRARELRRAGNLCEVLLWQQIHKQKFNGFDFDRQKVIGNYIVDFFCTNCRVVIEIDGNSHDGKVEYDQNRDRFLEGLGLTVIHILAKDILNRLGDVMTMLYHHPALQPTGTEGATLAAKDHVRWMEAALALARDAASAGEVPVGAVVVRGETVVARARNQCEARKNPMAHAELLALQEAVRVLGVARLTGCTLYVTLEPCPMCAGAVALARPDAVIFGALDPRAGCCGSVYRLTEDERLGLKPVPAHGGVLAEECGALLKAFFAAKR